MHYTEKFLVHDSLVLKITSSSPELMEYAVQCFRLFPTLGGSPTTTDLPEVELVLVKGIQRQPSEWMGKREEKLLWEVRTEDFVNLRYADRYVAYSGRCAFVEYFPSSGKAYAELSEDIYFYHLPFTCMISVLNWAFKEMAFFPVHAAAVGRDGTGLLLASPSGVGKSTTAVLLAKAGFSVLHDDFIWVQERGDSFYLFGVPCPIRLNQDMLRLLKITSDGQLSGKIRRESSALSSKYFFFAEDISLQSVPSVTCTAVCYLERYGVESSYRQIPSADALELLTKQSFLATDLSITKEYLETLVHLTEVVPQFLVVLGTDHQSTCEVFDHLILTA